MRFIELERLIKKNGWYLKNSNGTYNEIPNHPGDLDPKTVRSVLRSAGLK